VERQISERSLPTLQLVNYTLNGQKRLPGVGTAADEEAEALGWPEEVRLIDFVSIFVGFVSVSAFNALED
jgi:hypothetical protein